MRVLFLIPKNPPPVLEGTYSKYFKDFVAQCLQKEPGARPTAKDLLKHKFIKGAKKTSFLTELIERAARWQSVVPESSSSEEGDAADPDIDEADEAPAWDFGTVKETKPRTKTETPSVTATPTPAAPPKEAPKPKVAAPAPAAVPPPGPIRKTSSASGPAPMAKEAPSPTTSSTPSLSTSGSSIPAGAAPSSAGSKTGGRPSALTSVIYPVLSKMLKTNQNEQVISALAQLKLAFDNAEKAQPGITHNLIVQIIETLKR
eukprot:TRINITY_DN7193_c0_g2_i3.p1 TRINITY_DN7193_c0_g2~~TRINITY_DN7193_c0_g2_i3.p1  ORF type:complete len:295 (-),score=46.96 TRINITY_DN7193_c0_g2_i3:92-868(-)